MGFKDHMIEVSDKPLQLKGFSGDVRAGKYCNVRIKGCGWKDQNYVGGASNDLGFELLKDGSYGFHVSDYDSRTYHKNWQTRLLDQYAKATVYEVAEEQNFFIEDTIEANGEIHITLTSSF